MKKILYIGLFLIMACNQDRTFRAVEMMATLDTTYTTIGTPVIYTVSVSSPDEKIIQFPAWILENPVEVRSFSIQDGRNGSLGEFELVFWDTGKVAIPGLTINILNSDSTLSYEITADTMIMEVVSITEQDPTLLSQAAGGIMPIKDPVPITFPLPWKLIFLFLIMVGLLAGIISMWKKRQKAIISVEKRPQYLDPPDKIALEKLDALNRSGVLEKGDKKEFYAQLSHILREYTENSIYIRTLEMTTEEIRNHRLYFPYSGDQLDAYINILSGADMAKYAKHIAKLDQCIEDIGTARSLVEDTVQWWKFPGNS